ncbi:hypothetical protein [Streptomyces tauricus]|uniref:hypothetical protein n=1 Tax=Streptomyces tauricus TaxID=68274 RepID=UPI003F4CD6D4
MQTRKVTGFTNTEEGGVQLTDVVPFLVEDELKNLGGHYSKIGVWELARAISSGPTEAIPAGPEM